MNFCVVGAGAWGTAFAIHLARLGRPVVLVPRRPEQAKALNAVRENLDYLPGVVLPPGLTITSDLAQGLAGVDVVLLACPSQAMRDTCQRVRAALGGGLAPALVLSLAKGLELETHLRPSQLIAELLPTSIAGALTGPTNAGEIARGLPGAMVLAAPRDRKSTRLNSSHT